MASITSFSAVAALATSSGQNASGLCSDNNSLSGVEVQGDGLGGMQIKVTRNDGNTMQWTGTLSNSKNEQGSWLANLTCVAPGPHVGTGKKLGDPEDVDVTVQCGTNLARLPAAATLPHTTVKVGPAPT
jgi:hypothetical protein